MTKAQTPFERATNKALGQLLVERGFLTPEQCEQALAYAREHQKKIGEALVELGFVSSALLSEALGEQFGTRPMVLEPSMVDLDLLQRFPLDLLRRHHLLPLIDLGNEMVVAVGDPNDQEGLAALAEFVPDRRLIFQLADSREIAQCLAHPALARGADARREITQAEEDSGATAAFERWVCVHCPDPGDALIARVRHGRVAWYFRPWKSEALVPCEDGEVAWDQLAALLRQSVQWLPHGSWQLGTLCSDDRSMIIVTGTSDIAGLQFKFQRRAYFVPSLELAPGETWPTQPLVVLVADGPDDLTEAISAYVGTHAPEPAVVVGDSLPWIVDEDYVFSFVDGPPLAAAARAIDAQRIVFDYVPDPQRLSMLFWEIPRLKQVILCVSSAQWERSAGRLCSYLDPTGQPWAVVRWSATGPQLLQSGPEKTNSKEG
jgi:hypothetical protein